MVDVFVVDFSSKESRGEYVFPAMPRVGEVVRIRDVDYPVRLVQYKDGYVKTGKVGELYAVIYVG